MAAIKDPEGGNFLNFRLDQGWGEAHHAEIPSSSWSKERGLVTPIMHLIAMGRGRSARSANTE